MVLSITLCLDLSSTEFSNITKIEVIISFLTINKYVGTTEYARKIMCSAVNAILSTFRKLTKIGP